MRNHLKYVDRGTKTGAAILTIVGRLTNVEAATGTSPVTLPGQIADTETALYQHTVTQAEVTAGFILFPVTTIIPRVVNVNAMDFPRGDTVLLGSEVVIEGQNIRIQNSGSGDYGVGYVLSVMVTGPLI
jgi:hypothetical protein